MNKKWMVIGLLLLSAAQGYANCPNITDDDLYLYLDNEQEPMDLDLNIASSSAPNTVPQNSSSINERDKRKRTPSPLPIFQNKTQPQEQTVTDNNSIASSSITTLPISPQTLVTASMQKTKKLKSSTLSRDKKTSLECPYCEEAE